MTSSSRFSLPAAVASASAVSAALRARAMMSSACSRASARRPRYSASSSSDSWRWRSAASSDSAIVFARLSRASWIFGKATLLSTHIVNRKRIRVQIIRPETRRDQEAATAFLARRLRRQRERGYVAEQLHRA